MAAESIFSKIIGGEIPGVFVYEDEQCVVIMDAFPSVPGQCMVIPRQQIAYVADIPEALYIHLMQVTKKIMRALDMTFNTSRTCLVVEGFEVPHVHIKLYPIAKASGITALTDVIMHTTESSLSEREAAAKQIRAALQET